MEQTINNLTTAAVAILGILFWIYRDNLSQSRKDTADLRKQIKEDKHEYERKFEKLDAEIRSLENDKFNVIMVELGKISTQIATINNEISDLKNKKMQSQ